MNVTGGFYYRDNEGHGGTFVLKIESVRKEHAGLYRCEADNHIGRALSIESPLKVYCK